MTITRRDTDKDIVYQRCWETTLVSELASIPARHGDVAYVNETAAYYSWRDNDTWAKDSIGNFTTTLVNYQYSSSTGTPPGAQQIRFNAGFPYTTVTKLYFWNITADNQDIKVGLLRIQPGAIIYVQDKNDSADWASFQVTGDPIDNGTWTEYDVIHFDHGDAIGGGQLVLVQAGPGPTYPIPSGSATFITESDETANLPNSLQLQAGSNVSLDTSTPNIIVINAAGGGSPTIETTTSTGTVNDFDLDAQFTILRCNNASLLTLTGFTVMGTTPSDGDTVIVVGINAEVNFAHQTGSSAANQLINTVTSGITPILLGSATFVYDATTGKWRLTQHRQGQMIPVPYASGLFTANGTMTWTVDAADLECYSYYLEGNLLHILLSVFGSSVTAPLNNTLQLTLPNGYTGRVNNSGGSGTAASRGVAVGSNDGTTFAGGLRMANAATILQIRNSGAGTPNWGSAVNTTHVFIDVRVPIT